MIISFLLACVLISQEEIFESESERDYQLILNELEQLKKNPLDINIATIYDLARLPHLSIVLAYRIIQYRDEYGSFESIGELLKIEGMTRNILDKITPYIQTKRKAVARKNFWGRYRYERPLPHSKFGEKIYLRSIAEYHGLKCFLLTEKDHQEEDYIDYAAFGLLGNFNKRKFALGSYGLDFGRGMILGSKPTIFDGAKYRVIAVSRGIIPFTSVIEDGGFFGLAYGDSFFIEPTFFYSNLGLDGRLDPNGNVTSLNRTGLHIDSLSISRKNNLREEIYGCNLEKGWASTRLGLRSYYLRYNRSFAPTDSLSSFYGRHFFITGANAAYLKENFYLFSEIARSFNNQWSGVGGFVGDYGQFEMGLVFDYFMKGFYSPKSEMAEKDEAGAAANLRYQFDFADFETNVQLNRPLDSDTTDYYIKLAVDIPWSLFDIRLQLKRRYNENVTESTGSTVYLKFCPNKFLELYARFEEKYVFPAGFEKGSAQFWGSKLKYKNYNLTGAFGLFQTYSYTSRVYVFEPDLTGVINNHMFYGEGTYWFILGRVEPLKFVNIQAKYSEIKKEDKETELALQLDIKL